MERIVRVMFSLRMSSSFNTLSISRRLSVSTTRTFHCRALSASGYVGLAPCGAYFSVCSVTNFPQEDCDSGSVLVDMLHVLHMLTLPLGFYDGDGHDRRGYRSLCSSEDITSISCTCRLLLTS